MSVDTMTGVRGAEGIEPSDVWGVEDGGGESASTILRGNHVSGYSCNWDAAYHLNRVDAYPLNRVDAVVLTSSTA